MDFNVSVVIPVYNAERYLTKAVLSALEQPEVKEVILIEDNSPDNSLRICQELIDIDSRVKLYRHPDNINLGAGASRNLGIGKTTYEYISFLDADDFYLPGRFRCEPRIFIERPDIDGVYGALGFHYYSQTGKIKYDESGFSAMTTLSKFVHPHDLFFALIGILPDVTGYFHLDALTIKKSAFNKGAELFSNLRLHQDTVFTLQLVLNCKLYPGQIDKPIGCRGVHDNNRIVNNFRRTGSRVLIYQTLYNWARTKPQPEAIKFFFKAKIQHEKLLSISRVFAFFYFFSAIIKSRHFFIYRFFVNQPIRYIFGNRLGNMIIYFKEYIQRSFKLEDPSNVHLYRMMKSSVNKGSQNDFIKQ